MHHIQLDPVHIDKAAVKRYPLHVEQPAQDKDGFPHRGERFFSVDAHIPGQRVPPGANPANNPARRQVIQGQEGGCQQANVARPVVDDPEPTLIRSVTAA